MDETELCLVDIVCLCWRCAAAILLY